MSSKERNTRAVIEREFNDHCKYEFERLSREMNYYNTTATRHEDEMRIAVTYLGTVFVIAWMVAFYI